MKDLVLSVCLITYNHKNYIEQAIESIVMQQVNFTWNIIIADDFSTDGTREIVESYKAKYPDLITLLFQEKNVGAAQNFIDLITAAKGKYIAYLEGDDYWIDNLKLQKQVEVLEKNDEVVLCFTNYATLDKNNQIKEVLNKKETITQFSDIIKQNYIATLTVMFKNQNFKSLPNWYKNAKIGDWSLYLWLMRNGKKAYFLEESTAMYRTNIGVFESFKKPSKVNLLLLEILYFINNDLGFSTYKTQINESIQLKKTELLTDFVLENNFTNAVKFYFDLLRNKNKYQTTKLFLYSIYKKIKS